MLGYLEFIFEEADKIDGKFYYSRKFKQILKSIKNNKDVDISAVSAFLLTVENSNVRGDMTYIDSTDKNDMVSFLQINRANRKYDMDPENGDYDSFDDWLDFNWGVNNSPVWSEQRSEISIGRFVKRIVLSSKIFIEDNKIEKFVNAYKSFIDYEKSKKDRFQIVKGDDIKKYYLVTSYSSEKGQLGNSCMRYKSCQGYFSIYTENPDQVNLLILKDEGGEKIVGRSLIWKTTDDKLFMDRIYTIDDSDVYTFINYCKSMNILSKNETPWSTAVRMEVKLDKWIFEKYPYMDSFFCLNHKTGTLSANEDNWPSENYWKLQETTGDYLRGDVVWSEYHGEYIQKDLATWCENARDYVYQEDSIYLEYKNISASPAENTTHCYYDDSSYYTDDTIYSEYMSDYIYDKDAIEYFRTAKVTDFLHKEYEPLLVDVELDGDGVKSLPEYVILNPLDGLNYFKGHKIDGVDICEYIKKNSKTVSVEELEEYIVNSDFNLSNYLDKYNKLCYNNPQSGRLVFPRSFNTYKLTNIIKYMLLASPSGLERKHGIPKRNIDGFNEKIINKYPELSKRLIQKDDADYLISGGFYRQPAMYSTIALSDVFVYDILKDKEMLATWIKIKF